MKRNSFGQTNSGGKEFLIIFRNKIIFRNNILKGWLSDILTHLLMQPKFIQKNAETCKMPKT